VLSKEDQEAFDRLFDCAQLHIQAGVMVARPWRFEAVLMAVLLEHEKRVEQLESLLDEIQRHRQE
jgi:HD-like signal output (HDOD) protein